MLIDRHAPARRSGRHTPCAAAEIPSPEPDIVPLPPSPHPAPPAPGTPPEIEEPVVPGENEPVREPPVPPSALGRTERGAR